MSTEAKDYLYTDAGPAHTHAYLMPVVWETLRGCEAQGSSKRLFDLGCGNGSTAAELASQGWEVAGVDASESGVAQARRNYPNLAIRQGSAYDDLVSSFGQFPVVISLEVVEHLYAPKKYARTLYDLVEPGGVAIVSTPYHGYWKNLALALSGKMDAHFTALWDHGHIKFWSKRTLSLLLRNAGFELRSFHRVGRVATLAKSMIVVATKPSR